MGLGTDASDSEEDAEEEAPARRDKRGRWRPKHVLVGNVLGMPSVKRRGSPPTFARVPVPSTTRPISGVEYAVYWDPVKVGGPGAEFTFQRPAQYVGRPGKRQMRQDSITSQVARRFGSSRFGNYTRRPSDLEETRAQDMFAMYASNGDGSHNADTYRGHNRTYGVLECFAMCDVGNDWAERFANAKLLRACLWRPSHPRLPSSMARVPVQCTGRD